VIAEEINDPLSQARDRSWKRFGKRITLYLPGMFVLDGKTGKYPAISITGAECALQCDHCAGKILEPMPVAVTPEGLVEACLRAAEQGAEGVLITGGSDAQGRLPWEPFLGAIREVKERTSLHLSIHAGMVERETASALKAAGVDQALLDVVGDEQTLREVMHMEGGETLVRRSLDALCEAGLEIVPHVIMGLRFGQLSGERRALEILRDYPMRLLVWVGFMPLRGTPMAETPPLPIEDAGTLLAESRILFPDTEISLGCAKPRGFYRMALERLALDAGVNRMALYSEETVAYARSLGLDVDFQPTCCSMARASTE
jgi:uncharacterized radical SAM superfamily protein